MLIFYAGPHSFIHGCEGGGGRHSPTETQTVHRTVRGSIILLCVEWTFLFQVTLCLCGCCPFFWSHMSGGSQNVNFVKLPSFSVLQTAVPTGGLFAPRCTISGYLNYNILIIISQLTAAAVFVACQTIMKIM